MADGAPCVGRGSCAELLAKQFDVIRLVVGPTSLFTRTGSLAFQSPSGDGLWGIWEIPFDGSFPGEMPARGPNLGFGMALSEATLFGCDDVGQEALWRVTLSSAAVEPIVQEGCFDVVATGTHAYFTTPALGRVSKVPVGGGAVQVLASGFGSTDHVAVDDTNVYWSGSRLNGSRDDRGIFSMPLEGGPPASLAPGAAPARYAGLELDADWIYWLDEAGGVRRASKKGGPMEPEPPPLWGAAIRNGCFDFAVDERFIYCTTAEQVIRTPKDGAGSAEAVATGLEGRTEFIAVDATHIYFTVAGRSVPVQSVEADGIYRMPKSDS
jgi:hypothetical protein